MGLSVYLLSDAPIEMQREEVSRINAILEKYDFKPYLEPIKSSVSKIVFPAIEWTYAQADDLDIFIARLIHDQMWIPPSSRSAGRGSISLSTYQMILKQSRSHAVGFPKVYGFYVPVKFNSPLFHESPMLGSSVMLEQELKKMLLRLKLEIPSCSEVSEEITIKYENLPKTDLFGQEKVALIELYQLALYSVSYSTAIIFSG
jgi:hypothetical protein